MSKVTLDDLAVLDLVIVGVVRGLANAGLLFPILGFSVWFALRRRRPLLGRYAWLFATACGTVIVTVDLLLGNGPDFALVPYAVGVALLAYVFQGNDEAGTGGSPAAVRASDTSRGGGEEGTMSTGKGDRLQDGRGGDEGGHPPSDPQLLADIVIEGRNQFQTHGDYQAWARAMRKEVGAVVEPYLGRAWDELRREARATPRSSSNDPDEPPEQTVSDIPDPVLSRREPTSRIDTRRNLVAGVIALMVAMGLTAIIAFAWLVWPTPWRYHTTQGTLLREHRWSGEVERLIPTRGWRPVLNTLEGGFVLLPRTAVEELLFVALAALVLVGALFAWLVGRSRGSR